MGLLKLCKALLSIADSASGSRERGQGSFGLAGDERECRGFDKIANAASARSYCRQGLRSQIEPATDTGF
jgi:hypothetical protein